MGIQLGISLTGQRVGFNPASLFTASEPGFWGEISTSTLWQDTARTTPVTAVGQSVASRQLNTASGVIYAEQATAASRPLYALLPANGVRNLANGSADVGNAAIWPASVGNGGITATKVDSGFDTDGLPYVDYRYQGTASATQHTTTYAVQFSRSAAAIGQTFSTSAIFRFIGGSLTNVGGMQTQVAGEISPSTFNEFASSALATSPSDTTVIATRTLATAGTNQVRVAVILNFTNGATIDVTYRIKALQFELGSVRTAYQFNYAATNISQPPFAQVGALLYDGVDDWMATPAINFSTTDKMTVFAGVRKTSDAALGMLAELGAGPTTNSFGLVAPPSAAALYRFNSGGSLANAGQAAFSAAAPDTAVITGIGDISGDLSRIRRNGVVGTDGTADQGTGNYANAPIYLGARGGTTFFFRGYMFAIIVRGAASTASQISQAETWVNARTAGAY